MVPLGKALGGPSLILLVSGDYRHSLALVCMTLVPASLPLLCGSVAQISRSPSFLLQSSH